MQDGPAKQPTGQCEDPDSAEECGPGKGLGHWADSDLPARNRRRSEPGVASLQGVAGIGQIEKLEVPIACAAPGIE